MKKFMLLLGVLGVFVLADVPDAAASTTKQTATQALRSQSAANGTKRSFEIDLKKFAPKDATSQRMAGNAQRKVKRGLSKNNRKIQGRKKLSRDQKNYGSLNR